MGDGRPLLVVVGNCQAESYRLLLDAGDVRTQRIPALHELTPAGVPPLLELLARTDLFVSQSTRRPEMLDAALARGAPLLDVLDPGNSSTAGAT